MPTQPAKPPYERWLWIELIGFDNASEDFGVSRFLENAGFAPDAISFLMFNPDFIHSHGGSASDRAFPPDFCSYCGHPYNEERQRQDWTPRQLRGLVRELQKHGVRVYFAVFDMFVSQDWIGKHPEILHVRRTGDSIASVCPLKRFENGAYYEDFFSEKLTQVMADYGFDGYHGADGYAHPRIPIYIGDFSDDMVGQFTEASGMSLPDPAWLRCDGSSEMIARRADWIWHDRRREWIAFYSDRLKGFWRKVVSALHAQGKSVMLNSAWTRDPFEALYRYGIDYKGLVEAGVDGFIVEAAAGASESERGEASGRVLYDFMAMLLLNKASAPEAKMLYLNGVKDTLEQWNVLRHSPTVLEKEIYSLSGLYLRDAQGRLKPCAGGPVVCLADGIRPEEWRWLQEKWSLGFGALPRNICGATLAWSDAALKNQLEDFITTRRWTAHRFLYHLIAEGAPVRSAVDVAHLRAAKGPLLVLNPHLFPESEMAEIRAYRNGPVIMIGGENPGLPGPDLQFQDAGAAYPAFCGVWGGRPPTETPAPEPGEEYSPGDLLSLNDPLSFLEELSFQKVSGSFIEACAEVIAGCSQGVTALSGSEKTNAWAMELENGKLRVFIGNDSYAYSTPRLDVGREIARIEVRTPFPAMPVAFEGSRFSVKSPGRGMVVLEVETV
ncbi:MAG: hypothetical protein IT210_18015 [Armatimonadetes bacterium]|nr:hypothetical protein [Armatimonadota bacterium]